MNKNTDVEGIISDRDIYFAVVTNITGVLTLTLPRVIAKDTISIDGWLSILIGGSLACVIAFLITKISASFPNQSFFSYTSQLLSKPLAMIITLLFTLQYFAITTFHVREISALSHQYLFESTPIEVISLSFLLVVLYAVMGSRAAIFRLNVLFFPILIVGMLVVIVLPIGLIQLEDLLPVFQTDFKGYITSTYSSMTSFFGFGVAIFYIAYVKNPKKTPKMTAWGIMTLTLFNIVLYIVCIGTFGYLTTRNLFFPTFDLSRTVEIPGAFFERFDAILFALWTIILFTTTLMAFDITVLTIMMVFKKLKKFPIVLTLAPIIFFFSMIPKSYLELININRFMNHFIFINLLIVTILLGVAYKIKGGNQCE